MTFPGTVASLRQMWGRAGRRGRGLAVYVAGEDALDQFFCRHPDEFLDRPVEAAILDHENEQIHAAHLLCAAHEGPLAPDDDELLGAALAASRPSGSRRRARCAGGRAARFVPRDAGDYPAGAVSLRSTGRDGFAIVERRLGRAARDGRGGARVHARRTRAPSTCTAGARTRSRRSTWRRAARSCGRSRATGTRSPSARPTCTIERLLDRRECARRDAVLRHAWS